MSGIHGSFSTSSTSGKRVFVTSGGGGHAKVLSYDFTRAAGLDFEL